MANGTALEERRMALHDLLDRILISRADQPDAYRRIYLHEAYLRGWLLERPQWRLLTGPGFYRLERLPGQALPGRGLPRLRTPMDYACLCWALWFAETRSAGTQDWFILSELAAEITRVAGGRFSLGEHPHREGLVRALQLLVELGVLNHRDGDADRWASGQDMAGEPADVIYEFADSAPRLLANFDLAGLDRLTAAESGQRTLPPTGESAPPLARAWRALLLGPMLWCGDDPEAFAALQAAGERLAADLEQALGWELEAGSDFARIWRTTTARQAGGVLLDLIPDPGEAGVERHIKYLYHPILLLAAAVRSLVQAGRLQPDADGAVPVTGGALRDLLFDLYHRYRRNWGAELGEVGFDELWDRVLQQMRLMGYLRGPDPLDRCFLLPPAAQVVGAYAAGQGQGQADQSPQATTRPRQQSTLF